MVIEIKIPFSDQKRGGIGFLDCVIFPSFQAVRAIC